MPDRDSDDGYASPPCSAHEVDPAYMGLAAPEPLPRDELAALLNTLLEAERAGAKTLAWYVKTTPEGELRDALAGVARDEARYVALLGRLLRSLGATPSDATGAFFEKARAIDNPDERLAFLNRGQGWVARKLAEALPRIADPEMRAALEEMHRTHVENIDRCDGFAAAAKARPDPHRDAGAR
jgi:nitronate monooxygenase